MPLVSIIPNFGLIEDILSEERQVVHDTIKAAIMDVTGFGPEDVLVNLARCPWIMADPHSTDLTVTVATCPSDKLEPRANEFCEKVALALAEYWPTGTIDLTAEIWVQFLPGSWCLVRDGKIIETVPHPGAAPFTKEKTTE